MAPDVSVVIPSLEGEPLTRESVPPDVECEVVVNKPRAVARNFGVEHTSGDVIVFCDDDIKFSENFFWERVRELDQGEIIGLEDWDFGFLITRFMAITRKDFEEIGGFNESLNYMEDTEFCLNALSNGIQLIPYPRDAVYHEPHKSAGKNNYVILRNTLHLCMKYPEYAPKLITGTLKGGIKRKILRR